MGLQTQLEIAGVEVERAHARLAALEMERERAATQVRQITLCHAALLNSVLGFRVAACCGVVRRAGSRGRLIFRLKRFVKCW